VTSIHPMYTVDSVTFLHSMDTAKKRAFFRSRFRSGSVRYQRGVAFGSIEQSRPRQQQQQQQRRRRRRYPWYRASHQSCQTIASSRVDRSTAPYCREALLTPTLTPLVILPLTKDSDFQAARRERWSRPMMFNETEPLKPRTKIRPPGRGSRLSIEGRPRPKLWHSDRRRIETEPKRSVWRLRLGPKIDLKSDLVSSLLWA